MSFLNICGKIRGGKMENEEDEELEEELLREWQEERMLEELEEEMRLYEEAERKKIREKIRFAK